jgi:hypothetical protein
MRRERSSFVEPASAWPKTFADKERISTPR